jgi:hypothetical protein
MSLTYSPDQVSLGLLKETAQQISPALTLVFQASINQGKVPEEWKSANITPIGYPISLQWYNATRVSPFALNWLMVLIHYVIDILIVPLNVSTVYQSL